MTIARLCIALLAGAVLLGAGGKTAYAANEPAQCASFRAEWINKIPHTDVSLMRALRARLPPECEALKTEIDRALALAAPAGAGMATRGLARPAPPKPPPLPQVTTTAPQSRPTKSLLEVRGYVLSRIDDAPADAVAYAVPVFMTRMQAERFCPSFRARLTFEGALTAQTNLHVSYAGKPVEIVPFGWPVTLWTANTAPTCDVLVDRYDYGRARTMLRIARDQLQRSGRGQPTLLAEANGPFIVIARRVGGSVVIYDLSTAPDVDYDSWLLKTIAGLENENAATPVASVVTPGLRDQVRFVVFGAVPAISAALTELVPGFGRATSGSTK